MKTRHFAVDAPSKPTAGPAARLTSPKHMAAKVAGFPRYGRLQDQIGATRVRTLAQAFAETAETPLPDIQRSASQYVSRGAGGRFGDSLTS